MPLPPDMERFVTVQRERIDKLGRDFPPIAPHVSWLTVVEWYEAEVARLQAEVSRWYDEAGGDYYEEDEDPEEIHRIFEEGEKGLTASPPSPTSD